MTRLALAAIVLVQLACVMQTVHTLPPKREYSHATFARDERWQWHNVDAVVVGEAENMRERLLDE